MMGETMRGWMMDPALSAGIGLVMRATVLLAVAWAATVALRRRSADVRHRVWALAFAGVLALPMAGAVMPGWAVLPAAFSELLPASRAPSATATPRSVESGEGQTLRSPARDETSSQGVAAFGRDVEGRGVAGDVRLPDGVFETTPSVDPAGTRGATLGTTSATVLDAAGAAGPTPAGPVNQGHGASIPAIGALFILVWIFGAALRISLLGVGAARVAWLARRACPASPQLLSLNRRVARDLGLRTAPVLLVGDDAPVPMTWGVRRPRILLPAQAQSWSEARLRRVLLHEMAHIARRDLAAQWVSEVAVAIHWFNPLAWAAARRMRMEREHAADDLVLNQGVVASDYAEDLLHVVRGFAVPPVISGAVGMARPSQLGDRLRAVLDPERRREGSPLAARVLTMAGMVLVSLGLGAAMPAAQLGDPVSKVDGEEEVATHPETGMDQTARDPLATPSEEVEEASPGPELSWRGLVDFRDVREAAREEELCPYPRDFDDVDPVLGVIVTEDGGRIRGTIIDNSDDRAHRMMWTGAACQVRVSAPGEIRFTEDERDVEFLPRGTEFEARYLDRAGERTIRITAAGTRTYQVDGEDAGWGGEAEELLADVILGLHRRVGFQSEERALRILERDGLDALLEETARMRSDHVVKVYLATGFRGASAREARAVLDLAGDMLEAEYAMAEFLIEIAEGGRLSSRALDDVIGLTDRLDGDYETARVFMAILEGQRPEGASLTRILELASRKIDGDYEMGRIYRRLLQEPSLSNDAMEELIASAAADLDGDYELGRILQSFGERPELSEQVMQLALDAIAHLDGDYAKGEVLKAYLGRAQRPQDRVRILRMLDEIDGDHERAEILLGVLDRWDDEMTLQAAYQGIRGIDGGHDRGRVLTALLRGAERDSERVRTVLELTAGLSGYETAEVLTRMARAGLIGDELEPLFIERAAQLSGHDEDRALAALVRGGRGGN